MKSGKFALIASIAIPLTVGFVSSILSGGGMSTFGMLNKPPLSPPGWVFPVVWTILYILMGIASYLVAGSDEEMVTKALSLYSYQLAVNFLWPVFFFSFEWYLFAFFWILLLWGLVFMTTVLFGRISGVAGLLMVPYLLWITFAAYLNLGIWWLN